MQKDLKPLIENPQIFHGCLHFRYNKKKYLYGISEQLLTFGEENGLLSKINGTYQPSENQKKEKSTLQLKKQKTLMKVDYIILPRKACQDQYLWHFENLFSKLDCRIFLILTENQQKNKPQYASENYLLKRQIISLLKKDNLNLFMQSSLNLGFKIQMFKQHDNAIKKKLDQQSFQKPKTNQNILFDQVEEIYESDINHLIKQILQKQTQQYSQKSIFRNLNPSQIIKKLNSLLNEIRHNSNNDKQLQLTSQQIQVKKRELSQQILRISSSQNVIYPTQNQQAKLIFLPMTMMIGLIHKQNMMLINPSNLDSFKLHHLYLPVSKVKQIILTRFSMSFIEFIIPWSIIGEQQKAHIFIQIITLDWIFFKIKQKLYQLFLWDDQMIVSKIAFRIIPSNKSSNQQQTSHLNEHKDEFYNLGQLKLCYTRDQINQQSWIIRFGNKSILYLNEVLLWKQQWTTKYDYVIFDKLKQEIKREVYGMSTIKIQMSRKCIYNRYSSSKYRNKHLYCLLQKDPIIRVQSKIRIQQMFVPYISNQMQKQRYHKVRLYPGESVNCLDRNVIVVEGLVVVLNEFNINQNREQIKDVNKVLRQTYVWLCLPVDFVQNGVFTDLGLNKIRKVKELIALKQSLILVEQLDDQHFYQNNNHQQQFNYSSSKKINQSKNQFVTQIGQNLKNHKHTKTYQLISSPSITFDNLEISDVKSNSLIKILSKYSTNLHFSYKSINNHIKFNQLSSQNVQIFSPLYQFSNLFKKVTLQSGQYINQDNQKVYFVIKGSLKWKNYQQNQLTANNQSFIGNLQYFYQNKIRQNNLLQRNKNQYLTDNFNQQEQIVPIEVIKDTWALEADLKDLHDEFFVRFPEVSYWMVTQGNIFY